MCLAVPGKIVSIDTSNPDLRMAKVSFGGVLKGFLGAEYFIAPKFAIGSQITWGPAYVKTTDVDSDVQVTVFDISTNNIQGALMLSYYF